MDAKDQKRAFRLGSVEIAGSLVERLLAARVDGDMSREEYLWHRFLNEEDKRVSFEAFRLMLSYKYGKPSEKKEAAGEAGALGACSHIPPKLDTDSWAKTYARPGKDNS